MNYKKIEDYIHRKLKAELSPSLYYHGIHHSEEVVNNVEQIAENEHISEEDLKLLKLAALLHDIGFIGIYNGHEEYGCNIARELLPKFNVDSETIEKICGMIMATKIPQSPKNILEKIIADADLLYLGTDNFVEIGNTLFEELKENNKIKTQKEWNQLQAAFLSVHNFHTNYCIKKYSNKKADNLKMVNDWLRDN